MLKPCQIYLMNPFWVRVFEKLRIEPFSHVSYANEVSYSAEDIIGDYINSFVFHCGNFSQSRATHDFVSYIAQLVYIISIKATFTLCISDYNIGIPIYYLLRIYIRITRKLTEDISAACHLDLLVPS